MSAKKFCGTITCDECPWRTDVPVGKFPPERYIALANTCTGDDAFKPIFACHKSEEGKDVACVGYILSKHGQTNLAVRIALSRMGDVALKAAGPLFSSFVAMASANGVPRSFLRKLRFKR